MPMTGYVTKHADCPVIWYSKLQLEITLLAIEADYVNINQSMREVISFINLLKEINEEFTLNLNEPKFHCKVFENNNHCIAIATSQKLLPKTKHIEIKYH